MLFLVCCLVTIYFNFRLWTSMAVFGHRITCTFALLVCARMRLPILLLKTHVQLFVGTPLLGSYSLLGLRAVWKPLSTSSNTNLFVFLITDIIKYHKKEFNIKFKVKT